MCKTKKPKIYMAFVDFKKFFGCIIETHYSTNYKSVASQEMCIKYKKNQPILAITIVLKLNMDSQINLCHPLG